MCGIAGFIDFKKQSSKEDLLRMATCLKHRGPDGEGTYFERHAAAAIGLGHQRLSIIDLSHAADQPLHYNGLHIIFNGEIYNYTEIRESLIQKGHQFHTQSDTEVVLHAWEEWGPEAILHWHGMFVMVIFDERKNEVTCIRDRAGVKPFHYYFQDGLFLFGSELKSLVQHPRFKKEINPDAVASFFQYGYVPHPYTIYRHTHKLQPGHMLRLQLQTQAVSKVRYWNVYDYYNKPKLNISLQEATEHTELVLQKAFQYRMVADVPVGVFLSGGYDSSCVTALLQKDSTEKIKTFTIGTTDKKLDEAPFAKQIARHLGTDHTEYYCTPKEALDIIPDLPLYYDEPFADSSAIPTILVSRLAKKKVTVALSADAGDEIFAGYGKYDYLMQYGRKLQSIPAPVRRLTAAVMDGIDSDKIPYLREKTGFHNRYNKLKHLLINPSPAALLKSMNQTFTESELQHLFNAPFSIPATAHDSNELLPEYYDPLSFMMAVDYQTYLVDDILQKVDRATMSTSLEGREPFLDQNIIEWAAQLPVEYKYRKGEKKYILKQIVHKYIPQSIMDRPKMGFGIPVGDWLRSELKDLVTDAFTEEALSHGLFKKAEVRRLVKNFYDTPSGKHDKVWYLLMFQLWYRQWMQ